MGFYGSNDPTNSVKALKEVEVRKIGFNPTRSTSPCYNPTHVCNIQWYTWYIYKNESKHSEMGQVRQNPIQRTISLFICVCTALCTTVAHNIAQNRPDNCPSYSPGNHHCSDDVYLREGGGFFSSVHTSKTIGTPASLQHDTTVYLLSVTGMWCIKPRRDDQVDCMIAS